MENRSLGSWGVILDESVHEISGEVKDWEELEIAKVGDVIRYPMPLLSGLLSVRHYGMTT
jgi:hypothetical protein